MQLISAYPLGKTLAVVVFILAEAIIVNWLLRELLRVPKKLDTRRARTIASVVRSVTSIAVFGLAIYSIFLILGVDVTPLIASAGVAGLAIGFGARSLIEDLVSGMFLLTQDTIGIGDYVRLGGSQGQVEEINLRTISIRDQEGALHIIPNGQVKTVVNFSHDKTRISVDVPVAASQDIDQVINSLQNSLSLLKKDENLTKYILANSGIRGIEEIQPGNRLIVRVVIVTRADKRWQVAYQYRYLIKKEFEKENLSFA